MRKRSNREQVILEYIKSCVEKGLPPTIREICAEFNIKSTSTVHRYLKMLEEQFFHG